MIHPIAWTLPLPACIPPLGGHAESHLSTKSKEVSDDSDIPASALVSPLGAKDGFDGLDVLAPVGATSDSGSGHVVNTRFVSSVPPPAHLDLGSMRLSRPSY